MKTDPGCWAVILTLSPETLVPGSGLDPVAHELVQSGPWLLAALQDDHRNLQITALSCW